jgi:16S rRNA C967 or C1407 C5-methylase (RsmB/RsmF family)
LQGAHDFEPMPSDALPRELADLGADGGRLRTFPHLHDADGFFAARFGRRR